MSNARGIPAIALPKFVDLSKDARVAALHRLKGALAAAAELAHSKCAVTSGCLKDGNSSPVQLTIGGVSGHMYYGYPIENTRDGYIGIQALVNLSGFTYTDAGTTANFDKDGAPTPSSCRVLYAYTGITGTPPVINVIDTGC